MSILSEFKELGKLYREASQEKDPKKKSKLFGEFEAKRQVLKGKSK